VSEQTNSVRAGFPADLLVPLDRGGGESMRGQLEGGLRRAVQRGRLAPGSPLVPSRTLAAELGIARSVVVEAYGQLIAEGYLEARQGSGTWVRGPATTSPDPPAQPPRSMTRMLGGLPDPALFDRRQWQAHYRVALAELPDIELSYPGPLGAEALRAAVSTYIGRVRGVVAAPGEILITTGFTQGLTLLCRALAREGGRRVAVEDPCFGLHREAISMAGLTPVPVPVDEEGLDISQLRDDVAAVLVAPAHSYPLGSVLSAPRRHELVAWAHRQGAWLIEDDYDAEFRYDRAPIGALHGLSPDRVVYAGCASKTLTPALRLGWMAAPAELLGRLQAEKLFDDMGSGLLDQLALARMIEGGDFARHLRRVRPIYRRRRDAALLALAEALPSAVPRGVAAGLHVFLDLGPEVDEQALVRAAHARGVMVEASAWHWADSAAAPPGLVLGYGAVPEGALRRNIDIVAELANQHAASPIAVVGSARGG
jgi:GntR family transcriptional regulator/MocR family aminotransferase